MAATLDQVLAAVQLASRKIDTLISEMGIVMSLQDDLTAATATLTAEVAVLNTSYDQLSAILEQLRQSNVSADVVAAFDSALSGLKPSVDKIAALTQPPA